MTSNPEKSQISYLIRLIDDRDEFVRKRVREQLIKLGEDAIPFLEVAARTENLEIKSIASEIIQLVNGESSIEFIIDALCDKFEGAPREVISKDTLSMLQSLADKGFVVI